MDSHIRGITGEEEEVKGKGKVEGERRGEGGWGRGA